MDNLPVNSVVNPLVPTLRTTRPNLVSVVVAVICGIAFVGAMVGLFMEYRKNQTLSAELKVTKQQLQSTLGQLQKVEVELTVLTAYKKRQEKTKQLYEAVRGSFSPPLSSSNRIYLAVLLDDVGVCDDVEAGPDQGLCRDIFNKNCGGYEYPNRELCGQLALLRNREISTAEVIDYCNDSSLITSDSSQAHCFQYFARVLKQPDLCNEICRKPINNTNCMALCPAGVEPPVSCALQYKTDCRGQYSR